MNMRNLKLLSIFVSLFIFTMPAFAQVGMTGRVLSESGEGLPGAIIQLGNASATTDAAGQFTLTANSADNYVLKYSAENHFPMIHSYSPLELGWQPRQSPEDPVELPDVTLVSRAEGRVMLVFGGDAMMGRRFSKPAAGEPALIRDEHRAEDTLALMKHIKPYLEIADLASVNLETQVMSAKPEQNAPKSYVFFTPPEALSALKESGVDYVTLGNNHTYDYLATGLESTIDALNASGLGWSGAGMTETEALRPYRVQVGENKMSFMGFLGWAGNFNPNQVAQGTEKGGAAFGTTENIAQTVRGESEQGYLPVVQYHGSREYTDEPTLVTETRLKQAVDEGAVLAIGHHPHIVQGFEIYNDRLIAYSMGNFVFDQFHYATKRSYLLYVWMDREQLHRAEVVPIRIKGYTPIPATDTFRNTILKRVSNLSNRRGISLGTSGGNAVIRPPGKQIQFFESSTLVLPRAVFPRGASIISLPSRSWHKPFNVIESRPSGSSRVRLGKNLLPMGHLESHFLFDAPDRSWISDGSQSIVAKDDAPYGRNVMQLSIPGGQPEGRIGMRTFEYIFEPGTPTSFALQARTDSPAVVTAYQQWRKKDENRLEALESGRLRMIGQQELNTDGWQELRFDFDSPRVTAISYRVILKVEPLDSSKDHTTWFDDIRLIEWLSPPLNDGPVPEHVPYRLTTHAEVTTQ
jgi:poly-gamma-glutamate capsule biosynthesis protein CapA/YwtB (metallophosphatase superfamily)